MKGSMQNEPGLGGRSERGIRRTASVSGPTSFQWYTNLVTMVLSFSLEKEFIMSYDPNTA